jgi:putative addiction module component (TIGR02574 family)
MLDGTVRSVFRHDEAHRSGARRSTATRPGIATPIAAELLASLDGPSDPNAEAAWQAEIERRVADLKAGKVTLEPWDKVKRRIEKAILGR